MDEIEVLCDKIAVMINGQLKCLGSITDLKNRFGDGYRLIIKCNHDEYLELTVLNLEMFIRDNFPTALLEGKQNNLKNL
jgi:ABC-type multidrug transport system ATPase subunit